MKFKEQESVVHEFFGSGRITKIFPNAEDTVYGVDFGQNYLVFVPQKEIKAI